MTTPTKKQPSPRTKGCGPKHWKGRLIYSANGEVLVPLRDVFAICQIYCEYSEVTFTFYHATTDELLREFPRNEEYVTPWECLRSCGMLHKAEFLERAKEYLKNKPRVINGDADHHGINPAIINRK